MNRFTYEELSVGQSEQFSVEITKELQDMFCRMSGDTNPAHLEDTFAQGKGYRERLVYGMLTASFYSTLAGVYLPGENCILQEVNTRFHAPVYIGDRLTIQGTVKEKQDLFQRIKIKARITNQDGKRVSQAVIWAACTAANQASGEEQV